MTDPLLAEGDLVQFVDNKDRRYQATLTAGKEFHLHSGFIRHDDVMGIAEGSRIETNRGQVLLVIRPTLSEFILKMPRGAQVIYPKDIGPGMRVLESGVGSGALSMGMLRAGADIVGYELREDFADRARQNVEKFMGTDVLDRYRVELRDCYDGIDERGVDRVVLDLPEPWNVVPHAEVALRPGGLILAYTPSVTQVMQLRGTLERSNFFAPQTIEVLQRGWYVEGQAVRPDHRMVAHTGFLTVARLGA